LFLGVLIAHRPVVAVSRGCDPAADDGHAEATPAQATAIPFRIDKTPSLLLSGHLQSGSRR
jgi:hypothetical protein